MRSTSTHPRDDTRENGFGLGQFRLRVRTYLNNVYYGVIRKKDEFYV